VRELHGHPGIGPRVRGVALVARDGFSARYDLDRERGVFARPGHALVGCSYVGRVLVLDRAKGGVASAWMLHEMATRGMAPLALVLNHANPVMAQGAALAGIALIDRFATDVTRALASGEMLEVDPERGVVRVVTGVRPAGGEE
jgi:uncharacterized protein